MLRLTETYSIFSFLLYTDLDHAVRLGHSDQRQPLVLRFGRLSLFRQWLLTFQLASLPPAAAAVKLPTLGGVEY